MARKTITKTDIIARLNDEIESLEKLLKYWDEKRDGAISEKRSAYSWGKYDATSLTINRISAVIADIEKW